MLVVSGETGEDTVPLVATEVEIAGAVLAVWAETGEDAEPLVAGTVAEEVG